MNTRADVPTGVDRDRCPDAYFAQPDGSKRARSDDFVYVMRPPDLRLWRPG